MVVGLQAMDESLLTLTGDSAQVTNEAHNTAVRNRDNLRNGQAAVDGAQRSVDTLQAQIDSAASAVWDSDAPPEATVATTTTVPVATTSVAPAVSAKPSLLATGSCARLDLAKAEHVAAASQALLFWRLGATAAAPAEAARAESAAVTPKLSVANLGGRLRITGERPLLVVLVDGHELPISFADVVVPGEHALSGKVAAAEIQLVHMPSDGSKAVAVALQMDVGDGGNAWLQMEVPRTGEVADVQGADPLTMHPAFKRGVAGHYYRYDGQLRKDSQCTNVRSGPQLPFLRCFLLPLRWHILEERGRLSGSQLAVLQAALRSPADEPSALSPCLIHTCS